MFKRLMIGLVALGLVVIFITEAAQARAIRRRSSVDIFYTCQKFIPGSSTERDLCFGAESVSERIFAAVEVDTPGGDCAYFQIDGICYKPGCEIDSTLACIEGDVCGVFEKTTVGIRLDSFTVEEAIFAPDRTAIGIANLNPFDGEEECFDRGAGGFLDLLPNSLIAISDFTGSFSNIDEINPPESYVAIDVCPGFTVDLYSGEAIYDCELGWDSSPAFASVDRPKFPCCGETNELDVTIVGQGTVTSTNPDGIINCQTGNTGDCRELYDGTMPPYDGCPEEVELQAIEVPGWEFTEWSGGGCDGTGTCKVTPTGNTTTTVTAIFTKKTFPLTVEIVGNGTVTSDAPTVGGINCQTGNTGDCSEIYDWNTNVTLSAMPGDDSVFIGWEVEGCAGTDDCEVNVKEALTVTATFARPTLTVVITTLSGSEPDRGYAYLWDPRVKFDVPNVKNCTGTCTVQFDKGTSVTLKRANAPWEYWDGVCSEVPNSSLNCVFIMDRDQTAYAVFVDK